MALSRPKARACWPTILPSRQNSTCAARERISTRYYVASSDAIALLPGACTSIPSRTFAPPRRRPLRIRFAITDQRPTLLAQGHCDLHVRDMRRGFAKRRKAAVQATVKAVLPFVGANRFGGTNRWVKAPDGTDTEIIAKDLIADGVVVDPGAPVFRGRDPPAEFFRLGYSSIPLGGGFRGNSDDIGKSFGGRRYVTSGGFMVSTVRPPNRSCIEAGSTLGDSPNLTDAAIRLNGHGSPSDHVAASNAARGAHPAPSDARPGWAARRRPIAARRARAFRTDRGDRRGRQ